MTQHAGLGFRHTNGDAGKYHFPETFGGGCAFLDYDGDGWQDILLLSSGQLGANKEPNLALYRNEGDGTFADATQPAGLNAPLGYAQALAVGDFDNDGFPDVFVAGYGVCRLFRNRGRRRAIHGTSPQAPGFADVTRATGLLNRKDARRWASTTLWFDYDNDGRLDLYVGRYAVWTPETDRECPRADGSPGYCVPTVYPGDSPSLYRNEGSRFREVTSAAGLSGLRARALAVAPLDFNRDGYQDLYVANDLDPNSLLENGGDGTFKDVAAAKGVAYGADGLVASGMGIAIGDYENSGRESLFVTNLHGEGFSLFRAESDGIFSYATDRAGLLQATLPLSGWGTGFLDFDRDGWLDLVTANGSVHPLLTQDLPGIAYEEPMGLYRNTSQGRFTDVIALSGAMRRPRASRGLAVGDYDNDGRLDVLCVNRNERADLFRNDCPNGNHWISLRLIGTRSNRDAAGASVWITTAGVRRFATVRLGGSYASSSDPRLFFGLGEATAVDQIEVLWPSGRRDRERGIAVDRLYHWTEGGEIGRPEPPN